MRSLKAFIAAVALLCVGCVYRSPLPDQKQVIRPVRLEGRGLAPNFRLTLADGRKSSLRDFKGKYVLLNFFATWCKSCRYEFPTFSNLASGLNRDDFIILGVSVDEDLSAFKRFAAEHKDLKVVFVHDARFEGRSAFTVDALPVTFLLDKEQVFLSFFNPVKKINAPRVEGFETWDSKYMIDGFSKFLATD